MLKQNRRIMLLVTMIMAQLALFTGLLLSPYSRFFPLLLLGSPLSFGYFFNSKHPEPESQAMKVNGLRFSVGLICGAGLYWLNRLSVPGDNEMFMAIGGLLIFIFSLPSGLAFVIEIVFFKIIFKKDTHWNN